MAEAYRLEGFEDVTFLPEPEAAALSTGGEGRILIVDTGGGTSDFTLCDRQGGETRVLTSTGMRLGVRFSTSGSASDRPGRVWAMAPRSATNRAKARTRSPRRRFVDGAATLREVCQWERLSPQLHLFTRLGEMLESHLGHEIAFSVEAAPITAIGASAGMTELGMVELGLRASGCTLAT